MINGTNTESSGNTENSVTTTSNSQFVTETPKGLVDQEKTTDTETIKVDPGLDTVSHKSYQKLLNQHKTQQARLKELEAKEQEREEQEQLKRGEYDKVMRLKEEKIKTLQDRISAQENEQVEGKKLMAFMDKLPGQISDNDYLSHIDIDSIVIDSETGEVDPLSLEKEVERFSKKHWRVIDYGNKKGLPNVGHLGGKANVKRNLKEMTREELRQNFRKGNFV